MFWTLFLGALLIPSVAQAHCDIPCGIYTPEIALLAAKTVWTMVKKIKESKQSQNAITRMVTVKEQHAQLCKQELLILWTDYFKPEHLEKFPKLHETVWKATKLCSKNKQNVDLKSAEELKKAVNQVAQIFYKAEEAQKTVKAA